MQNAKEVGWREYCVAKSFLLFVKGLSAKKKENFVGLSRMSVVDTVDFPSASFIDVWVYIFLNLFFTALWVYIYRDRSFTFLALAMFFPSLFAIVMHVSHGTFFHFISFLFFRPQWSTVYWSIFASISPIVTVIICCLMNYVVGWGHFRREEMTVSSIHEHNQNLFYGWIRAMGEEIGWRSYLLPRLLIHFHPFLALNISGLVWGFYHVPVMILLCHKSQFKVPHPLRTILVQCFSCWISAFVYGWIGIQCQYAFLPPTMKHLIWNRVNPLLLGSIYTNTPGWMIGDQWKINGEGLMGCIVYFCLAILVVIHLY